MKIRDLAVLCCICVIPFSVQAEGLPANPWASKQEVIGNTVLRVSREDINPPAQSSDNQENGIQYKQQWRNITKQIENKWQQKNAQTTTENTSGNEDVNAVDALNALNTLSRYMNQNNGNNTNTNTSSESLANLKQKLSGMINKNGTQETAPKSSASKELNKIKYQYNRYKSQFNQEYNTIKNKTKPLYNTMKSSIQEAERATGVNF